MLCLLKEKAEHLCYKNRDETEYHPAEYNKPGSKRKLTIIMVGVNISTFTFTSEIARERSSG